MSDSRNEKLESMLRFRRLAKASPDLAERIILRARTLPQRKEISLWRMIQDLFAEFHLPKPAYVLAGALALGVVLGLSTPSDYSLPRDGIDSQAFFNADEGFL